MGQEVKFIEITDRSSIANRIVFLNPATIVGAVSQPATYKNDEMYEIHTVSGLSFRVDKSDFSKLVYCDDSDSKKYVK